MGSGAVTGAWGAASKACSPELLALLDKMFAPLCLPPNWKEVEDPNTGEPVYYNPETGETQSERPTERPTAEEILKSSEILDLEAFADNKERKRLELEASMS